MEKINDDGKHIRMLKTKIKLLLSKLKKDKESENNNTSFNRGKTIEELSKELVELADLLSQCTNLKLDETHVKAFNAYVKKHYKYVPIRTNKKLPNIISTLMDDVRKCTLKSTTKSVSIIALRKHTGGSMHSKSPLKPMKFLAVFSRTTLEDRVEAYNIFDDVFNLQMTLKPCIYNSNGDRFIRNNKDENVIDLGKRIGSYSLYGMVYASSGLNSNKLLGFSTKLMKDNDSNQLEVKLLQAMTDLAISGICQNMPITYKVMECNKTCEQMNKESDICPDVIKHDRYLVVLNELANYSMDSFLESPHNLKTFQSVVMQILFSIYSFHSLGYCHQDAHMGNFLIHEIVADGLWHYKVVGEDIYVKNYGYLVVLWDPGLAKPFSEYPEEKFGEILEDYARAIDVIIGYIKQKNFEESLESLEFLTNLYNGIGLGDDIDPEKVRLDIKDENSLMSFMIQEIYHNTTIHKEPSENIINKGKPFTLKYTSAQGIGGQRNIRRKVKTVKQK